MSDYLGDLATRCLNPTEGILPRLASRFEPVATEAALAYNRSSLTDERAYDVDIESVIRSRAPAGRSTLPMMGIVSGALPPKSAKDAIPDLAEPTATGTTKSAQPGDTLRASTGSGASWPSAYNDELEDDVALTAHRSPTSRSCSQLATQIATVTAATGSNDPLSSAHNYELGDDVAPAVHCASPASSYSQLPAQYDVSLSRDLRQSLRSAVPPVMGKEEADAPLGPGHKEVIQPLVQQQSMPDDQGLDSRIRMTVESVWARQRFEREAEATREAGEGGVHSPFTSQSPAEKRPVPSLAGSEPEPHEMTLARAIVRPQIAIAPPASLGSPTSAPLTRLPTEPERTTPSTVHVTIGRVEVRATPAPAATSMRKPKTSLVLSLDDYLRQRNGGSR